MADQKSSDNDKQTPNYLKYMDPYILNRWGNGAWAKNLLDVFPYYRSDPSVAVEKEPDPNFDYYQDTMQQPLNNEDDAAPEANNPRHNGPTSCGEEARKKQSAAKGGVLDRIPGYSSLRSQGVKYEYSQYEYSSLRSMRKQEQSKRRMKAASLTSEASVASIIRDLAKPSKPSNRQNDASVTHPTRTTRGEKSKSTGRLETKEKRRKSRLTEED